MRILFFARVADSRLFDLLEFYREDLEIFRGEGHEVLVHSSISAACQARADFVYCWWWHTALPVVAAHRSRGVPVVVTGTSDLRNPQLSQRKRAARAAATAACAHLASLNLAVSEFELADLARLRANAEVVHCSIDENLYRIRRTVRDPSAVLVAQMNELSIRRKGVDVAVAAAKLVKRERPEFTLTLVGPADAAGSQWLQRNLPGDGSVVYVGEVTREMKAELLSQAQLYVQPSSYEGFGLAVVEAMASGCVPVVSPSGALPEVVGDEGILVAGRSAEDFAREILQQLDNPRLQEARVSASVRASALFGRERRRKALVNVVDSLTGS